MILSSCGMANRVFSKALLISAVMQKRGRNPLFAKPQLLVLVCTLSTLNMFLGFWYSFYFIKLCLYAINSLAQKQHAPVVCSISGLRIFAMILYNYNYYQESGILYSYIALGIYVPCCQFILGQGGRPAIYKVGCCLYNINLKSIIMNELNCQL